MILHQRAKEAARRISASDFVRIISHIDSDGLGAGAVAKAALDRAGIDNEITFIRSLEPDSIPSIAEGLPAGGLLWFCDLGSGVLPQLEGIPSVITDHHMPRYPATEVPQEKRGDLMAFSDEVESAPSTITLLNPHEFGIDGSRDLSGAGATYLAARELGAGNEDLSMFAVIGAVGDIQTTDNRLTGLNREILITAVENGLIRIEMDLIFYGRETRDVIQMLSHASEPPIPTLFRKPDKAKDLFEHLGIDILGVDKNVKHWTELSKEERKKTISALTKLMLVHGGGEPVAADKIIGEVYVLAGEEVGSPLRDAREYSTLLNACGRYGHFDTALKICMGERGEVLERGTRLMWDHRANLVKFIEVVKEAGFHDRNSYTYFDTGDKIPEEVVGIVLGILMSSTDLDHSRPVFAFASSSQTGQVKVSARVHRVLVDEGLNLSRILKTCCAAAGGSGGGHDAAAGGTIPRTSLPEFLDLLELELG